MESNAGDFIGFVNYCNNHLSNSTDYGISRVMLKQILATQDYSIESIAEEACVSQASVSRFIRKSGFQSFPKFRNDVSTAIIDIAVNRRMAHQLSYANQNDETIADTIFDRIQNNLNQTKETLDIPLLIEIVGLITAAKTVSIYGDEHALASFFTVQLDLTVKEKTVYLYKNEQLAVQHEHFLNENDVVIFLNEFDKFLSEKQIDLLQKLNRRKIKVILFSQDQLRSISDYVTIHYQYGVPQSSNDGYYSLFYLSNLLSELVIRYSK